MIHSILKEGWRCEPEEGRIEKRERIGGERDEERGEADEAGGSGNERREVDKKERVEPLREVDKKERVELMRRTSSPLGKAEGQGREQDQTAHLNDDHPARVLDEEEPHQGQQKAAGLQLPLVS